MASRKTGTGTSSRRRANARDDAPAAADPAAAARELARAGRHAQATEVCTRALAGASNNDATRMTLLDLRAES